MILKEDYHLHLVYPVIRKGEMLQIFKKQEVFHE
jgi:hypothetical protein